MCLRMTQKSFVKLHLHQSDKHTKFTKSNVIIFEVRATKVF